jgi:outer membrane murein-binding lipoprotein Lpp
MANISGLNHLFCDKLTIRKPRPSLQRGDVFTMFLRNPETFSRFENNAWIPLDNQHVAGVQDMVTHVTGNVSILQQQIDNLTTMYNTLNGQVQNIQQQLDGPNGLVSSVSTLLATVNALGRTVAALQSILELP